MRHAMYAATEGASYRPSRSMGISALVTTKKNWHAYDDSHVTSGQKRVTEYSCYRFVGCMLTFLNLCLYWRVAFERNLGEICLKCGRFTSLTIGWRRAEVLTLPYRHVAGSLYAVRDPSGVKTFTRKDILLLYTSLSSHVKEINFTASIFWVFVYFWSSNRIFLW